MTLKHKDVWTERYRGVTIEIVHWGVGKEFQPLGVWNYYLHIPLEQIPPERLEEFRLPGKPSELGDGRWWEYPYMASEVWSDLDWHGGITYYERRRDGENPRELIVAGCDYNHLDDEGRLYSVEHIQDDARRTVDRLWEVVPNLRRWCHWCGSWTTEGEEGGEDWTCAACVAAGHGPKKEAKV